MKTLYFDCSSGISGDMTVAALLDLGGDRQALVDGLKSLGIGGYRLEFSRVKKNGIDACDFNVLLGEEDHLALEAPHHHGSDPLPGWEEPPPGQEPHYEPLYDQMPEHGHEHVHSAGHNHEQEHHEHDHGPHDHGGEHHHHHEHRTFGQIRDIILDSGITPWAKEKALKIFKVVAEAEAKVHAMPVEEVHFHEVGAVDSIVDIVGAAILIDSLGVERIICSPLVEGKGRVKCQHGWMPVPAPATLEIIRSHHIPLTILEQEGELVTPTGAAIVAALADKIGAPEHFSVEEVGYGAGKRNYPHTAGVLRILEVAETLAPEEAETAGHDAVCEISCNLDDIASESLAFACEELLRAGALDVWVTPATMKKGRPGHILALLCEPGREGEFSLLLLRHTSAIGVRSCRKNRTVMDRRQFAVETPYGPVLVKESTLDGMRKIKVEFESARQIALEKGLPIQTVLSAAHSALTQRFEGSRN